MISSFNIAANKKTGINTGNLHGCINANFQIKICVICSIIISALQHRMWESFTAAFVEPIYVLHLKQK